MHCYTVLNYLNSDHEITAIAIILFQTENVRLEWNTENVDLCVPTHVTATLAGTHAFHCDVLLGVVSALRIM